MNARKYLFAAALSAVLTGTFYFAGVSTAQQATRREQTPRSDNAYQIGAVLYMQKAAEYRALAYQAFNLARWQLDADFERKNVRRLSRAERRKPRAVVVDIDETVLDNSPAQAYGIKNNLAFNLPDWYAWGNMRKAKAIPGSVEFLNYAASRGVRVFYVSNRDEVQKQATIDNLKSVGFSDISAQNVMLRTTESTKEPRRQSISASHRIVLLVGDNLDDFSNVFERRSIIERFAAVDNARGEWGKRFIVLPNAMYGTWESAIYNYERLTEAQKAERRAEALELP
jgi:5'-nucleotidase (lipoprotein e(P4) family)